MNSKVEIGAFSNSLNITPNGEGTSHIVTVASSNIIIWLTDFLE